MFRDIFFLAFRQRQQSLCSGTPWMLHNESSVLPSPYHRILLRQGILHFFSRNWKFLFISCEFKFDTLPLPSSSRAERLLPGVELSARLMREPPPLVDILFASSLFLYGSLLACQKNVLWSNILPSFLLSCTTTAYPLSINFVYAIVFLPTIFLWSGVLSISWMRW